MLFFVSCFLQLEYFLPFIIPFYFQLTPVGLTVFRGIHAIDKDKPNTPNSDVTYSIVVSKINGKYYNIIKTPENLTYI